MEAIRKYQENAAERICAFLDTDQPKARVFLATGLGKTRVLAAALSQLFRQRDGFSAAVLVSTQTEKEEMRAQLQKALEGISVFSDPEEQREGALLVTTQRTSAKQWQALEKFSLVVFVGLGLCLAGFGEKADRLAAKGVKLLGLFSGQEERAAWFREAPCLFAYSFADAARDGYVAFTPEKQIIDGFLCQLLTELGYTEIEKEAELTLSQDRAMRIDLCAEKDGTKVFFEVKTFRSRQAAAASLESGVAQIARYKTQLQLDPAQKNSRFILVLPCELGEEAKREVLTRFAVTVWDIKNLLYLCGENGRLLQLLQASVPYPVSGLTGTAPAGGSDRPAPAVRGPAPSAAPEAYIELLSQLPCGRANQADKAYEELCGKIIELLFGAEFYHFSKQQETADRMFRMDLLCSLKGTTEFWKFLMFFYRTRFVVFEFKNYGKQLEQNLIYTTEKYLFSTALRNVAFLVSRKGFDANAERAALGCLRESGKLIVSLDDEDLKQMLAMKLNGEEPSDYLLDKVEKLLMSVSK